jgi:DNA mismatch repair protein MutS2
LDRETLKALDFYRIKEMLAGFCATDIGRERVQQLLPTLTRKQVETEFDRLEELLTLVAEPPVAGLVDIRRLLLQTEAGGILTPDELLQVKRVCTTITSCQEYFRQYANRLSTLRPLVDLITDVSELQRQIERVVDDSGAIKDTASERLLEVRIELRKRRNLLVERMEQMLEKEPEWFEGTVMVRRERFVLPVRIEFKNQVPGVVHSVSASGQTVFIEPLETIAEQNRLQELRDGEQEEIARLRRELSMRVWQNAQALRAGIAAIAEIDVLLAKRRFTIKFNCNRPQIDDNGRLALFQAKHPLLVTHKTEVVPLDFQPPDGVKIVVVSGPNAGGKTVVLKTLGVCTLLLKCGMFIPAAGRSQLPWFDDVFADIGDEQSLEADVSSFTAHIHRLKQILSDADEHSLVLVDEIGSATAPEEGSALAITVLEELRNRDVFTVATTHFNSLKAFVQNETGMVNAGMEFRNGPTYRLIMGLPGDSSAFEIAERSGLPREIITRAKKRMGSEWIDFKAKLQELEKELQAAIRVRQEAEVQRVQAEMMVRDYEKRLKDFDVWQNQERRRFLQEQERELKERRREIEKLVRELREHRADHDSIVRAKGFVEQELSNVEKRIRAVGDAVAGTETAVPVFRVGDIVEAEVFRRQGRVVENKGERVVVEFGNIKLEIDARGLKLAQPAPNRRQENTSEEFEFVPKLNLRGMTRDEAEIALSRFLSEAVMAGAQELSILHGKGTGTLRQMLWKKLRQDARVAEIRFAEPAAGGMGVTVIKLRSPAGKGNG